MESKGFSYFTLARALMRSARGYDREKIFEEMLVDEAAIERMSEKGVKFNTPNRRVVPDYIYHIDNILVRDIERICADANARFEVAAAACRKAENESKSAPPSLPPSPEIPTPTPTYSSLRK